MKPAAKPFFRIQMPSTFDDIRTVLRQLDMHLSGAGFANDQRGKVQLVLAEVLNNIAEHAYPDTPGPIFLEMETTSAGLSILVSDRGRTLPWKTVQVETAFPLPDPRHDLREGGFGWHIITALADDVRYTREVDVNRLWLMMATPAAPAQRSGAQRLAALAARRQKTEDADVPAAGSSDGIAPPS